MAGQVPHGGVKVGVAMANPNPRAVPPDRGRAPVLARVVRDLARCLVGEFPDKETALLAADLVRAYAAATASQRGEGKPCRTR